MEPEIEARHLTEFYAERKTELLSFLSGQLAVLRSQGQAYLGIASVCISVTGFAGHNMVNAGPWSAGAMILGIFLILVAIVITLRALASVRWVSQHLGSASEVLAQRAIERRNVLASRLATAAALIGAGLAFYLAAVVLAAFSNARWTPP